MKTNKEPTQSLHLCLFWLKNSPDFHRKMKLSTNEDLITPNYSWLFSCFCEYMFIIHSKRSCSFFSCVGVQFYYLLSFSMLDHSKAMESLGFPRINLFYFGQGVRDNRIWSYLGDTIYWVFLCWIIQKRWSQLFHEEIFYEVHECTKYFLWPLKCKSII